MTAIPAACRHQEGGWKDETIGTETQQPQVGICSWGRGRGLSPGEGDPLGYSQRPQRPLESAGQAKASVTQGIQTFHPLPRACLPVPPRATHCRPSSLLCPSGNVEPTARMVLERRASLVAPGARAFPAQTRGSTHRSSWSLSVPTSRSDLFRDPISCL